MLCVYIFHPYTTFELYLSVHLGTVCMSGVNLAFFLLPFHVTHNANNNTDNDACDDENNSDCYENPHESVRRSSTAYD